MTRKHPASMDELSMWDNPDESPLVRQLLRAGRVDQVDYDLDAGLARHLANLQAGTQLPPWAVAQSTVQKTWSPALLAWLLPPMISAAFVGAWLYLRPAEPVPPVIVPQPATSVAANTALSVAPSLAPAPAQSPRTLAVQPASAIANPAPEALAQQEVRDDDPDAQLKPRVGTPARILGRHVVVAHRSHGPHEREAERASSLEGLGSVAAHGGGTSSSSSAAPSSAANSISTTAPAESHGEPASTPAATPAAQPHEQPPVVPSARIENDRRDPEPQAVRTPGVSDSRLEREMQMLAVAQRVLTTDPERSLRLTRQGEKEFRGSMFSAERTQVSLLALVQLGRLDEARRLGIPFLKAYPNAPWSARLSQALSTGRVPSSSK